MKTTTPPCFRLRLPDGQFLAALLLAALLSPAVLAAPAPPGRTQRLASPDAVPDGLSAADWSGIRQQVEQQRHAAVPVDGGHQARNPGQHWLTRFDGRGFLTRPEAGGWQWGLELQRYGFAGHERALTGQPRVNTAGPRVTYDWDATLQEWFVNDRRGLEHGFTVRERPPHPIFDHPLPRGGGEGRGEGAAPLTFTLAVRGGLRPEVEADGRGVRFVDAQGAAALTYSGLTVRDADGRTLPARFEPVEWERGCVRSTSRSTLEDSDPLRLVRWTQPRSDQWALRLAIEERGARYPLTIDPIAQQAYLKASNTAGALPGECCGDMFGESVAVSGETVVVGAANEDSAATGVNGDQSDNSATNSGAAYVFVRTGTTWTQQAYLKASNAGGPSPGEWLVFGDFFGASVAISGDTVVVGASGEDSAATGVNGDEGDNSATHSGAAYVFVRDGTIWSQKAYLKASNTDAFDQFGASVAVSGDTVVVGAPNENSNATDVNGDQNDNSVTHSGAAYVFVRNGTTWTQQAYLKASNTDAEDRFGEKVAISGDTVVVGAPQEDSAATGVNGNQSDNSAPYSGAAYVFVRNGTTWSQQAYLKASNTAGAIPGEPYGDMFGWSVAVSGDTMVIGAPREDGAATGVNGDQNDNSTTDSGAAYVFERNGTTWTQQAYLKASNTEAGDAFGRSVAISGDTVVIGANGESNSATGVNGGQSDNSASGSGAAYVFVRNGTTWTQQAYLKASNTDASDWFGDLVAVSGDTVVVGAFHESSAATGVNGNQSDNSALLAGAAYVFTGFGPPPQLTLLPDGSGGYFIRCAGIGGRTYQLQRAANLSGPWPAIATSTAPSSGLLEFHDTAPLPTRAFYRTVQP